MTFDFKKKEKLFYQPKQEPELITLPPMKYLLVEGQGDPNEEEGAYAQAVSLLYAMSYALRMSEKKNYFIPAYEPYVVAPLEGIWWSDDKQFKQGDTIDKSKLQWLSILRQPDFIRDEDVVWACDYVAKHKHLDVSKVQFTTLDEGTSVQMMHVGSYDDEPASFVQMDAWIQKHGYNYRNCIGERTFPYIHHEIYLSDPRKCDVTKMKTVIRRQITKK